MYMQIHEVLSEGEAFKGKKNFGWVKNTFMKLAKLGLPEHQVMKFVLGIF